MKTISKALTITLFLFLASCALNPTAEQIAAADYGAPITEEKAISIADQFLENRLKDKSSAKIEWGSFNKSWLREGIIHGGGTKYGYQLMARVNAKNSFGGYTGWKQYVFLLRDDRVVSAYAERTVRGQYGSHEEMSKIY